MQRKATSNQDISSKTALLSYVFMMTGIMIILILPFSLWVAYSNKKISIGTYLESHFEFQSNILKNYTLYLFMSVICSVIVVRFVSMENIFDEVLWLISTFQSFFLLVYGFPKFFVGWKSLKNKKPITAKEKNKNFWIDEIRRFQYNLAALKKDI